VPEGSILDIDTLQHRVRAERVAHGGYVGSDRAVTKRDQNFGALADEPNPLFILFGAHRALYERHVHVVRELLGIHNRAVN
jgi:hypothetical protein